MPKTLSEVQMWLNTIVPLLRFHYNIELEEAHHLHGLPTMYCILYHAVIKEKYYSHEMVISCNGIWKGDVTKLTEECVRQLLVPEIDVRVKYIREALISVDEEPVIVADKINEIISKSILAHTITWDIEMAQVLKLIQIENLKNCSDKLVDITYVEPEIKTIDTPWGNIETNVFYITYTYVAKRAGATVYSDVVQSLNMPRAIQRFRLYSATFDRISGFLFCDHVTNCSSEQTVFSYNSTFFEDQEALCKQVVDDLWHQNILPNLFFIEWDMLFHQHNIEANSPNKRAKAV
jgi:hypothetical protein